jgi:hypothetical protein
MVFSDVVFSIFMRLCVTIVIGIVFKDPHATPAKKTTKPKPTTGKSSPSPEAVISSPLSQSAKRPQQGRTVPPKTFPKIKVWTYHL